MLAAAASPPPPSGPPDLIGSVVDPDPASGVNQPLLALTLPGGVSVGDFCALLMASSGALDPPAGWDPSTILATLTPTASAGRLTLIGGPLLPADVAAGVIEVPTTGGLNLRIAGCGEVCGPAVVDALVVDPINSNGTSTTSPSCTPTTDVRLLRGYGCLVNLAAAGPCTWLTPDGLAQDSNPSMSLRNCTCALSDVVFAGDGVTPTGTATAPSVDALAAPLAIQRQALTLALRRP
ncbi:MAG TPA: hypothetical protein VIO38_17255 [Rariglobus sp.]